MSQVTPIIDDVAAGREGDPSAEATLSRRTFLHGAAAGTAGLLTATEALAQGAPAADLKTSETGIVLARQGSFYVGGRMVKAAGAFDPSKPGIPPSNAGASFWINQMYAGYQMPRNPRTLPIVLWHGGGLTSHVWESTPDGRPGFQSLLLQSGYTVYTLDQVGRGRSNIATFNGPFGQLDGNQVIANTTSSYSLEAAWCRDRLGPAPYQFFPNTAFPQGSEEPYFKQMGFVTSLPFADAVAGAVALFDRIGPAILVVHSSSGIQGLRTAMRTPNVRAVISYEASGSAFPQGQIPPIPKLADGSTIFTPAEFPEGDFARLATIPIQMVFGDNIPSEPMPASWFTDWWRVTRYAHGKSVEAINARNGKASVLDLPSIGLRGNTHFPFTDRNNEQVAAALVAFLSSHNLDRREG